MSERAVPHVRKLLGHSVCASFVTSGASVKNTGVSSSLSGKFIGEVERGEAGALAKNLDRSKVCPMLFGLEPADIPGPLVQFQASRFDVYEMRRVVKMINAELGDAVLATDVLENVLTCGDRD